MYDGYVYVAILSYAMHMLKNIVAFTRKHTISMNSKGLASASIEPSDLPCVSTVPKRDSITACSSYSCPSCFDAIALVAFGKPLALSLMAQRQNMLQPHLYQPPYSPTSGLLLIKRSSLSTQIPLFLLPPFARQHFHQRQFSLISSSSSVRDDCYSVEVPLLNLTFCSWSNPSLNLSASFIMSSAAASSTSPSLPSRSAFPIDMNDADRSSYLSSTSTSLIACITPMIGLMYLVVLSWTYTVAHKNPRPLNKTSGVRLQRYAPGAWSIPSFWGLGRFCMLTFLSQAVYVFLVLSSLTEVCQLDFRS